ncbi:hypothetical protein H0A36_18765 [Endozoicomonas sp. SM1973]|uniref:FTP domain-containing protein n=1 Tax=Spartinivicinus marinus TaxID=2994442 RepID=A0A853IDR4_9GAMM|nr:hypothetical protein [Spartinivicinus marinus]MCX4029730.1 hypothetical protein [Spartinivicinus marinus]NYZ68061.1 hypothetical protein [Spartinivicinus marinus]
MRDQRLFVLTLLLFTLNSWSVELVKPLDASQIKVANNQLHFVHQSFSKPENDEQSDYLLENTIILKQVEKAAKIEDKGYEKYQQLYQGVEVEGAGLILTRDSQSQLDKIFYQNLYQGIVSDINSVTPPVAFSIAKVKPWLIDNFLNGKQALSDWQLSDYAVKPAIYIDQQFCVDHL